MQGMIDPEILTELLRQNNISVIEARREMPQMLILMESYFMAHAEEWPQERLPGAIDLLRSLHSLGVPNGVLTGNLEVIGRERLRRSCLAPFITAGAFSNHAQRRTDIFPLAKKLFEGVLERDLYPQHFVVIADTVKDVIFARECSLQIIAVATGGSTKEDLNHSGADLVLDSLEQSREIKEFLKW